MSIRVFLVEDMQHLQGVVVDLLRSVGDFELVGSATTEAEAIGWLADHAGGWDLLVLDLVLAQGTGLGVITRTRERGPGSRVVVFSDYVTPGIRQHCMNLGADAAIAKSDTAAFIAFCSQVAGA